MQENFLELARNIRRSLRSPVINHRAYQDIVRDKVGLEIGGPSEIFRRVLPIYEIARSVDGVNFSSNTMWEGQLVEGQTYAYLGDRIGRQYICDATNLDSIGTESYDFVVSSNNLEHIANPLKAVGEWLRVLRTNGCLFLVLPRKESNFDRKRDVTTFEHLMDDLEKDTPESDLTHLEEIIERHDYAMDPPILRRFMSLATLRGFRPAMTPATMRQRGLANFENRGLHHHVFDHDLLEKIFRHFGMRLVLKTSTKIDHIAVAQKVC